MLAPPSLLLSLLPLIVCARQRPHTHTRTHCLCTHVRTPTQGLSGCREGFGRRRGSRRRIYRGRLRVTLFLSLSPSLSLSVELMYHYVVRHLDRDISFAISLRLCLSVLLSKSLSALSYPVSACPVSLSPSLSGLALSAPSLRGIDVIFDCGRAVKNKGPDINKGVPSCTRTQAYMSFT